MQPPVRHNNVEPRRRSIARKRAIYVQPPSFDEVEIEKCAGNEAGIAADNFDRRALRRRAIQIDIEG